MVWAGLRTSASQEDFARAVRVLRAPAAGSVRRMCGRVEVDDHHGYPARVEVELLALTDCVGGCVKRGYTNLPSAEAEGLCGWYHSAPDGKNKEVAEMAKKEMKHLKEEVEKKGQKLSIMENGKEGKERTS